MTAREEDEALLEVDDVLPDVEEEHAFTRHGNSSDRSALRHRAVDEVKLLPGVDRAGHRLSGYGVVERVGTANVLDDAGHIAIVVGEHRAFELEREAIAQVEVAAIGKEVVAGVRPRYVHWPVGRGGRRMTSMTAKPRTTAIAVLANKAPPRVAVGSIVSRALCRKQHSQQADVSRTRRRDLAIPRPPPSRICLGSGRRRSWRRNRTSRSCGSSAAPRHSRALTTLRS